VGRFDYRAWSRFDYRSQFVEVGCDLVYRFAMQQPRPEPTEPIHDALKADMLKGLEQADAGLCVSADEMREIFGIAQASK